MRTAEIKRKTSETDIGLKLNLDGSGKGTIQTGVGFMDHMLTLFARHGRVDLDVICRGDTVIDDHHSVEDIGIVTLTNKDVVRHRLVKEIIRAFEKAEK